MTECVAPIGAFDFKNLFVLDMANNHQGSVEHGLMIIRGVGKVVQPQGVRAGIKFQFRQLDTFIHPDHQKGSANKHIPRFLSTRLDRAQYQQLLDEVRALGLLAICTPFDEESVDIIVDMGFDLLKVASCSAKDWPLLEKIASANLPVIFSTGGLAIEDIDSVVSFFEHRGVDYAIMHCVSIYPIPEANFQLNQIEFLRNRYPDRVIGWSTHEVPDELGAVQMAVAKGAQMFERHIGLATDEIKLNAYSSTPEQVDAWVSAYKRARVMCGAKVRPQATEAERVSIDTLRRGVYVRGPIKAGQTLIRDDVYFAMPYNDGQLESGGWREGIVALADVALNAPVMMEHVKISSDPDYHVLQRAVHEVKAMLNEARIVLNSEFDVEYSHHYGIQNFRKYGAVIINCINRQYCKKIIVQLPGQTHPSHFHRRKEETFQVLYGTLKVYVDGHLRTFGPGQTCLVQAGVWHAFSTDTGCIFEEVSTTHYKDDSFYKDKRISALHLSERKTKVNHWGRWELKDKRETPIEPLSSPEIKPEDIEKTE